MVQNKQRSDYFIPVTKQEEEDMAAGTKKTKEIHAHHINVFFSGTRCFKGTFALQVKQGMKPYEVLP